MLWVLTLKTFQYKEILIITMAFELLITIIGKYSIKIELTIHKARNQVNLLF